jgi:predicted nucleotidyltransferase component of viral defense system
MARERYVDQVRLLVDILPAIAAEEDFALKGGTAINLFYRDLPRLSVDIDLTFLPIKDRAQSLADIDGAMDRIGRAGSKMRGVTSTRITGGSGGATRVLFQRGSATVKVETSPVTRGVVFEPAMKRVSSVVEDDFGFAETRLVAFEDLYAGKLHEPQHPIAYWYHTCLALPPRARSRAHKKLARYPASSMPGFRFRTFRA